MSVLLILGILCIVGAVVLTVLAFLPMGGSQPSEHEEDASGDDRDEP